MIQLFEPFRELAMALNSCVRILGCHVVALAMLVAYAQPSFSQVSCRVIGHDYYGNRVIICCDADGNCWRR
jgi:hypothetical protein